MSIIIYKCTVCDREIEKPQNPKGLEVINRCVITDGCRGSLYKVGDRQNHVRGKFPSPVEGLTDWVQRKVLHDHVQSISANKWVIEHNLGINPIVNVYIEDYAGELVETEPSKIILVDQNTTHVVFDRRVKGIAQLIGQSTKSVKLSEQNEIAELNKTTTTASTAISNAGVVTFAIRSDVDTVDPDTIKIQFSKMRTSNVPTLYEYNVTTSSFGSAWSTVNSVKLFNKEYNIHTFNFNTDSSSSDVPVTEGATLYFSEFNGGALGDKEVLILLAKPPYNIVDIVTTDVVDVSNVNANNAVNGFFLTSVSGQIVLNVNNTFVDKVFPRIQVLS